MKLLVLDGNSILNRAFYGIRLLSTKEGQFTNGIYGFLTMLFKLQDDVMPDGVAIAFDLKAPTFRHKRYADYKANRKGMPEELASQMEPLKQLLKLMGYCLLECEGYEADDILGTLAVRCRGKGDECVIATGDRDSLQLVGGGIVVRLAATKMGRPESTVYDADKIKEEYGVTPPQLIDIKALQGDASDNIPGVAGIGKVTAASLIQSFGSVDAVYEHIDSPGIKEGVRQKLIAGKDSAYLSRELGTVFTEVPIAVSGECFKRSPAAESEIAAMMTQLEFFKMMEKLGITATAVSAPSQMMNENTVTKIHTISDINCEISSLEQEGQCFLSVQYKDNSIAAIALGKKDSVLCITAKDDGFDPLLSTILQSEKIGIITHDVKPLWRYCFQNGVAMQNVVFDTMLAGYLLNPSASGYDTGRLAAEYGVSADISDETDPVVKTAAVLPLLYTTLAKEIESKGQKKLLDTIELPLAEVLAAMEHEGFEVDAAGLAEYGKLLESNLADLQHEIVDLVGYDFNINSPKQLGEALFHKLGLPTKKKTKSGFSTDAETLESLRDAHPVVNLVLQYRSYSKLKSTYADGLIKVIGPDGRIHTSFNQAETRTGRISSTEPNLQNIPVRTELGRELRRFFRAREGFLLVDADYSQIELRVLGHVANDKAMIDAFCHNEDIHRLTASEVFNIPFPLVTPLMRSRAKAVNFGIVYGIGAFSLSKDIGVTRKEAQTYIDEYLNTYSGVKHYMDHMVEQAKSCGFSETIFGRRRYLPELTSSNRNLQAFGERVARNMPIQGAAADIIKIAMIRVYRRLKSEGMRAKLILQVHDELLIEAPDDEAAKAASIIKEEMEASADLSVPLLADANRGKTWFDAH